MILAEETINNKACRVLYTCGDKTNGKLGQGEEIEDYATFSRIKSLENEDIVMFSYKKKHGAAVTSNGKLFT